MSLINENTKSEFNLKEIGKGWLLFGRHKTWNEGKSGIVTSANAQKLVVQFYPGIGNVTNHYFIPVGEVISGQWEIRWSKDMSEIFSYPEEEEPQEPSETETPSGTDEGNGENNDNQADTGADGENSDNVSDGDNTGNTSNAEESENNVDILPNEEVGDENSDNDDLHGI